MSGYLILPTLAVTPFDTVVKTATSRHGSCALRRGVAIIVPTRAIAERTLRLMGLSPLAIDKALDGNHQGQPR